MEMIRHGLFASPTCETMSTGELKEKTTFVDIKK